MTKMVIGSLMSLALWSSVGTAQDRAQLIGKIYDASK